MPLNIEDLDLVGLSPINIPLFLSISGDRHAWDTIILYSLVTGLFGRTISGQEVADVINARDGRIDDALGSDSVKYMFEAARLPRFQEATTCQYQKWADVSACKPVGHAALIHMDTISLDYPNAFVRLRTRHVAHLPLHTTFAQPMVKYNFLSKRY